MRWPLAFFALALLAGALGFGGITTKATGLAQLVFFACMLLSLFSLLVGLIRDRSV